MMEEGQTEPNQGARHGRLRPGPRPATIDDLRAVQHRDQLLRTELPRLRESAGAWRNGVGALLAGLIGFSLIKGRSDVGQLAVSWARAVGVVLLLALVAGVVGAMLLLRAAYGNPAVVASRGLPTARAAEHLEALASARALRRGVGATLGCALLLTAAVGATWYGPEKAKPKLRVMTGAGAICGSVVRLGNGILVLKTDAGEIGTDLSAVIGLQPMEACP